MDDSIDVELTEQTPRTLEVVESKKRSAPTPLAAGRAAQGTKTRLAALPPPNGRARTSTTIPPPLPASVSSAAIRVPAATPATPSGSIKVAEGTPAPVLVKPAGSQSSARITMPPPIPQAASQSSARITIPPPIPQGARAGGSSARITMPPPLPASVSSAKIAVPVVEAAPVMAPDLIISKPVTISLASLVPPTAIEIDHTPLPPPQTYDEPTDEDDFEAEAATNFEVGSARAQDLIGFDDSVDYVPPKSKRNVGMIVGAGMAGGLVAALLAIGLWGGGSSSKTAPAKPAATKVAAATPIDAPKPAVVEPVAVAAPVAAAPAPVEPAAAPVPAAAIAPVAAPVAAAETPVANAPATHDISITSNLAGATVTLIDDGDAQVIGKTPVTATVDPTHHYDLVVAMHGVPTKIQKLDPTKTAEITVELGTAKAAAAVAPAPAPVQHVVEHERVAQTEPVVHHEAKHVEHREVAKAEPRHAETRTAAKKTTVAAAGDGGTLMVSAKPPCQIAIDGRSLHVSTPQRALALSAGPHQLTLTNPSMHIAKTISVKIAPHQPTKIIQDFTK